MMIIYSCLHCDALVLVKLMNSRCCSPYRLYMLHGNNHHHMKERSILVTSSSQQQQSSIFPSSLHMLRTIPSITELSRTRRRSWHVFSRMMNSGNDYNNNNINNKYNYNSNDDQSHNSSYNNNSSYSYRSSNDNFLSPSDDVSRQLDNDILSTSATTTTATTTATTSLKSSKDIYMNRLKLTSSILMMSTSSYFISIQNNIKSVNAIDYKNKNKNNIKDGAVGYEAAESAFAPGQQRLAVPILSQSALLNTLPINNLLIGQLQGFIESFVQLLNPSDKQINQIKLNSSVLWSNLRINAQRAAGMFLYNQVGR